MYIFIGIMILAAMAGVGGFGGTAIGIAMGLLLAKAIGLQQRLDRLQEQVAAIASKPVADAVSPRPPQPEPRYTVPQPPQPTPRPTPAPPAQPAVGKLPTADVGQDAVATAAAANAARARRIAAADAARAATQTTELPPSAIQRFFSEGNWLARIGIVILFFGVAFLLKYAAQHTHVPIQVRLMGVALGAVVLLVLGWRFRHRRALYALALQGGGVGVLYLNLFAALRLYELIPAGAAFALLAAVAALSAALAVMQNARSLAILGMAGGFLAPILTSSGTGSHVMLFSYYALLNLGIVGIAWFRAWRELNLLGFVFTFVIASAWGYLSYRPEYFASTEPFLIFFFLAYLGIAILFTERQATGRPNYIDGTLVFGVPIVGFSLQAALMRDMEYGLGWSALALAAIYLLSATALWQQRHERRRFLVEAFLALGAIFLTLTFPLLLDNRWTSAAWAIEGAGIAWVGMRQGRVLPQVFGVLLQFAAGIALLLFAQQSSSAEIATLPVFNHLFVGGVLIVAASFFTSLGLYRGANERSKDYAAILFTWGVLWWFGLVASEVEQYVTAPYRIGAHVALTAVSAILALLLARALEWRWLCWPALALTPLLFGYGLFAWFHHGHMLINSSAWAWPFAIAVAYVTLRKAEKWDLQVAPWHAAMLWLIVGIATIEARWFAQRAGVASGWIDAAMALPAVFALVALVRVRADKRWPFGAYRDVYTGWALAPLVAGLAIWSLRSALHTAAAAPLPYLPLLNPLDVVNAMWLIAAALFVIELKTRVDTETHDLLAWILGALVFVWLNAVLLRSLHHFTGVAYRVDALSGSVMVQSALSLFWSVCALGAMILSRKWNWRPLWVVGAILLAVVVLKLFLVDLSNTGTVARIVSFIGVGVLLLLIGYAAPVPPRIAAGERQ